MRNVFDQYQQTENRVTHAFVTTLAQDRFLLGRFLREVLGQSPPASPPHLEVLSQSYPGEIDPSEDEAERRGVPDAWIFDVASGWCVLIESKVLAALSLDQLARHRRTAERLGFKKVRVVAIVLGRGRIPPSGKDAQILRWSEIYRWLVRHRTRPWAGRAAEYFEIVESRLIEKEKISEGTLTMFAGFPFTRDRPYSYLEGKRTLLLAREELRASKALQKKLGVDPSVNGRPAITGSKGDVVWDFLALSGERDAGNFTRYPHLSLGVHVRMVDAMVTVPNAVQSRSRAALQALGEDGFRRLLSEVLRNMRALIRKNPGVTPVLHAAQRRWPSQRARPFRDAEIVFDLRTALPGNSGPKFQPVWLTAAYGALVDKRGSNYELQVGVHFPYDRCPRLRQPSALGMIEDAWLACKPLVDLVR